MIISSRTRRTDKCTLTLPCFTSEESLEVPQAALLNSFCDRLACEIMSYASSGEVRRYSTDFTAESEGDILTVSILLKARKTSDHGIATVKKKLITRWRKTKLISINTRMV